MSDKDKEKNKKPAKRTARSEGRDSGVKFSKEQSRDSIIEAVGRVIAKNGIANATVEAIAEEAGMSKGGVLHYFPSKKALLFEMVNQYEKRFRDRQEKMLAKLPPTRHSALKAVALLMLADMDEHPEEVPNMASVLDDPELRQCVCALKKRTFKQVINGVEDPAAVSLVMYAIDGMWMDMKFSPMVIPTRERKAAIKAMVKYIDSLDADEEGS